MATRIETNVVYAAGLVQGIVLVTFPAASTIFTDPDEYDLSSSQYGAMFLPQVVTAIAGSLLGAGLAGRFGSKRVYLAGLSASLVAMGLLVLSTPFTDDKSVAYALLLVSTACLGAGFGLTVPTLNTFTAVFHPAAVDRSVLVLNALLGAGTALAPLFVAMFVGLGFWWGLPVLSAVLLAALLLASTRLPLRTGARAAAAAAPDHRTAIPSRFWLFAVFAVLYGICETMNGNWSQLDMTTELGASTTSASIALTTFWAMVTVGRVLFASIQRWFPTHRTYHVLPFILAGAFVIIASLPDGSTVGGILGFGLAGLGCSALLPLTISFAQADLVSMSAATAGLVIAAYQLGYGLAAFGAGPLQDAGVTLPTLFAIAAVAAGVLAILSFVIARPEHAVTAIHPRPSPSPSPS
jgi:MFS family permease